jgi:hypothetical protein
LMVHFMAILPIERPLGIFWLLWSFGKYIFPFLVGCTKKNLATLPDKETFT